MRAPGAGPAGVLRVYELTGPVLSLGRYHLAPVPPAACGVQLVRRHSGGRVAPWGEGFVGVSLVLPHRAALFSSDPLALVPDQLLNRHVRGLLGACSLAGVSAFYPGRDLITVEGRILGVLSCEVDAAGAFLMEAVIANHLDLSSLPALLDAVDPHGTITAGMLTPNDTTSLARTLGQGLRLEEVAALIRRGYEERLGVDVTERAFSDRETQATLDLAARELADDRWLGERVPRADHERHAATPTQLGVLEAHFAIAGGRLTHITLAGDFIANSSGIMQLEHALRGCPAEASAIDRVVTAVFSDPTNWILGIGPLGTIAATIQKGLAG